MQLILSLLLVTILGNGYPKPVAFGQSFTEPARMIVHLLDYLARDYSGAVNDESEVINAAEYNEQMEFVGSVKLASREVLEIANFPEVQIKLQNLEQLIKDKAVPKHVTTLAREIQQLVIGITKIPLVPNQWPDLKVGAQLFDKNCASCHGLQGRGDGVFSATLEPKPTDFTNLAALQDLTPFGAYNTIRLGIQGTGMLAFHDLSDANVWSLAFYVNALRFQQANQLVISATFDQEPYLNKVATLSDADLLATISGTAEERQQWLIMLRTFSGGDDQNNGNHFISLARQKLRETLHQYANGMSVAAKNLAIAAYLQGVEPIEPRLKANNPSAVIFLEGKMLTVRALIDQHAPLMQLTAATDDALLYLDQVESMIKDKKISPLISFLAAFIIILREGFEAVLIIWALLGVIKATGSRFARLWVHGGWISAVLLGFTAWFFSGWLMAMSGADREMLEGITSIFAVVILLYVGFWLHRQTEANRWRHFLEVKVKGMLNSKKLIGLAFIAFIAVFREAIETILFLRALWIDAGQVAKSAMTLGVFSSFSLVIFLAWLTLRLTSRVPIRSLFNISSIIMLVLAIILVGKGMHSIQETGLISVTSSWLNWRIDLLGFYPTLETILAQTFTLIVVICLWSISKKKLAPQKRSL